MGVGLAAGDLLDQNVVAAHLWQLYHSARICLLLVQISRVLCQRLRRIEPQLAILRVSHHIDLRVGWLETWLLLPIRDDLLVLWLLPWRLSHNLNFLLAQHPVCSQVARRLFVLAAQQRDVLEALHALLALASVQA